MSEQTKRKVTLVIWAEQRFHPAPAERTLRRWVKEGRIVPAPVLLGRTYYVDPAAQHIAEAEAALRTRTTTHHGSTTPLKGAQRLARRPARA
jgi:hypothetical protein